MNSFKLLLFTLLLPLAAFGQRSYTFSCDVYNENGTKTFTNIPGKIFVDTDGDGSYVLMISVRNPAKRNGVMPFGYWTDPDSRQYIRYHAKHPYDDTLRKVYYIYTDDEELCVATLYKNSSPDKIRISYRYQDKKPSYIEIPYTYANEKGVYGAINESKKVIPYQVGR